MAFSYNKFKTKIEIVKFTDTDYDIYLKVK